MISLLTDITIFRPIICGGGAYSNFNECKKGGSAQEYDKEMYYMVEKQCILKYDPPLKLK